jgi:hypothetical protein
LLRGYATSRELEVAKEFGTWRQQDKAVAPVSAMLGFI